MGGGCSVERDPRACDVHVEQLCICSNSTCPRAATQSDATGEADIRPCSPSDVCAHEHESKVHIIWCTMAWGMRSSSESTSPRATRPIRLSCNSWYRRHAGLNAVLACGTRRKTAPGLCSLPRRLAMAGAQPSATSMPASWPRPWQRPTGSGQTSTEETGGALQAHQPPGASEPPQATAALKACSQPQGPTELRWSVGRLLSALNLDGVSPAGTVQQQVRCKYQPYAPGYHFQPDAPPEPLDCSFNGTVQRQAGDRVDAPPGLIDRSCKISGRPPQRPRRRHAAAALDVQQSEAPDHGSADRWLHEQMEALLQDCRDHRAESRRQRREAEEGVADSDDSTSSTELERSVQRFVLLQHSLDGLFGRC